MFISKFKNTRLVRGHCTSGWIITQQTPITEERMTVCYSHHLSFTNTTTETKLEIGHGIDDDLEVPITNGVT